MKFKKYILSFLFCFVSCVPDFYERISSNTRKISELKIPIESPTDEQDPRIDWMKDLEQPRLIFKHANDWKCVNAKYIYTLRKPLTCQDIQTSESVDWQLECNLNEGLKVFSKGYPCVESSVISALNPAQFIRLMPGHGFFRQTEDRNYEKNPSENNSQVELPVLEWKRSSDSFLVSPEWREWAQENSTEKKYIQFQWDIADKNIGNEQQKYILSQLFQWMQLEQRPAVLDWVLGLNFTSTMQNGLNANRGPDYFFELQCSYRDLLYQDFCLYMGQWLLSRQVLKDLSLRSKKRKILLNGHFVSRWKGEFIPAIVLADLPLPWVHVKTRQYYFRSEEDARSISAFQGLAQDFILLQDEFPFTKTKK